VQLVTYRAPGAEQDRLGALDGGDVVDLSAAHARAAAGAPFPRSMLDLLRAGEAGLEAARAALASARDDPDLRTPRADVRLRAPLPRPNSMRDFMLVEEHVRNSFGEVPEAWYEIPVYWKGNCDTVYGPDDEVPWPHYTEKLDYELEVGAVIGRHARRVSVGEAADCIAGYTIFNDWSARDIQFREMAVGIGPAFGKDFATSLGPCLVTADAIDIGTARMTARVNGEVWSDGDLGSMRFSFPEVISILSAEQPLQPGDVLGSGTVGRGCGLELDRWIQQGDVVELEVAGIGVLRNPVGRKRRPPDRALPLPAAH
jgi:2-keto-4-pentenoate hydratase/2-oxohepta-3-ene-1,7-dioic acid hydratase in catechol pathway